MPLASSQAPALAGTWCRLHPLSPVARTVISLGVVVAAGLTSLSGQQSSSGQTVYMVAIAAAAVLVVAAAVVSWLVTRWRVVGDELQIDTGLVYRQSLRFPLRRVQAVDVVAPLTARILGLAEVRVVSAGTGHRQHGRLAYLSNQDAAAVRAQLLALAHGLAAETPEPPARPLGRPTSPPSPPSRPVRSAGPWLWHATMGATPRPSAVKSGRSRRLPSCGNPTWSFTPSRARRPGRMTSGSIRST